MTQSGHHNIQIAGNHNTVHLKPKKESCEDTSWTYVPLWIKLGLILTMLLIYLVFTYMALKHALSYKRVVSPLLTHKHPSHTWDFINLKMTIVPKNVSLT